MNGETLLRIDRRVDESREVFALDGELDLTNIDMLATALATSTSSSVILDVSGLTFIDSAGIRAIDEVHRELAEAGKTLLLVAPTGSRAAGTFRIAGFAESFVLESLELALRGSEREAF